MEKISACLVIRNEEKLLKRCLESIKHSVSEIIVVHDGKCTDTSLAIARSYNSKIYVRDFVGEAEYHRPFSYEQAIGDWILQIDADEFLVQKRRDSIYSLLNNKTVDAYQFAWIYYDGKKHLTSGPFSKTYKPCLLRKSKLFMIGLSHEYPRTYGEMETRVDFHLVHEPLYNNYTWQRFQKKWIPWARLQAKQIYLLETAPVFNISKDGKTDNKVYKHYLSKRAHPFFSTLQDSVKFITIYFSRGIVTAGFTSIKIALFEIGYLWLVNYYLFSYKYGKRV